MASRDNIPSRGSWRQKGVEVRREERFFHSSNRDSIWLARLVGCNGWMPGYLRKSEKDVNNQDSGGRKPRSSSIRDLGRTSLAFPLDLGCGASASLYPSLHSWEECDWHLQSGAYPGPGRQGCSGCQLCVPREEVL